MLFSLRKLVKPLMKNPCLGTDQLHSGSKLPEPCGGASHSLAFCRPEDDIKDRPQKDSYARLLDMGTVQPC